MNLASKILTREGWVAAALALVVFALYWPVRTHEFINCDDPDYLTENPIVQRGLTADGVVWAFSGARAANWHPLTWLSHMLDCQVFGMNAGAHHLVNVAFHALNAILLLLAWRRLTGDFWPAAWVAALFALHPLRVESVAWVAERKDVLSAFWGFLALWAYAGYVRDRNWRRYAAVLGCFALGLLSKPMLVTWPCVLLLLDFWPLRRFEFGTWAGLRPLLFEKVPFFALSAASCLVTLWAQGQGQAVVSTSLFPLPDRIANAFVSWLRYLGKTLWPQDLSIYYPHPVTWPPALAVAGLALVVGVCALAWWQRRQRPWLLTGWLWYLGTLVPVIGIIQVGGQAMADRYTYLPLIGVYVMLAWTAAAWVEQAPRLKPVFATAAVVLLAACAVGTARYLACWKNSLILLEQAVKATGGSPFVFNNLGDALMSAGRVEEATTNFQAALQRDPRDFYSLANLSNLELLRGNLDEAVNYLRRALELKPRQAEARCALGFVLGQQGKVEEALSQLQQAVEIDPYHLRSRLLLGNQLGGLNRWPEAMTQFTEGLRIAPASAPLRAALGTALARTGQFAEAEVQLTEAVRLNPADAQSHQELGVILSAQGRTADAIAQYRESVRLAPNSIQSLNNLAWLYAAHPDARFRDGATAVLLGERACQITQERGAFLLGTLAAAYAEAGRFQDAEATALKAIAMAQEANLPDTLVSNQKLLKLYRAGQPARDPSLAPTNAPPRP